MSNRIGCCQRCQRVSRLMGGERLCSTCFSRVPGQRRRSHERALASPAELVRLSELVRLKLPLFPDRRRDRTLD